jgi:hypothetical protein
MADRDDPRPRGTVTTTQMGGGATWTSAFYTQPDDCGRTLRLTVSSRSGPSQTFVVRVKR